MSKSTMDGPKLDPNPGNGPSMPRKIRTAPNRERPRSRRCPLTWAFACGAGDENRTRIISLED